MAARRPSSKRPPRASRDRQGAEGSGAPVHEVQPVRLLRSLTVAARTGRAREFRTRHAFTLVEVAAVTLLLALLAAGVALSFAGPLRSMRAGDAVERVRAFDATARLAARRSGREVEMTFDGPGNGLSRRDDPDGRDGGVVAYRGALPGGYRVDGVLQATADGPDADRRTSRVVRCSPAGRTRSYAVRVVGPGLDRWLVFAGLSGQVTEARDETDVEAIFDAVRPRPGRE